jgi:hypothetical protein
LYRYKDKGYNQCREGRAGTSPAQWNKIKEKEKVERPGESYVAWTMMDLQDFQRPERERIFAV